MTAPGSGRLLEGRAFDALALVVVTLFVAIFYWPARACGLLSDGWALLHVASKPLAEAVATRLSYHFIPGTHLLNGLLWRLLGAHDEAYQTVNLTELALVGFAVYLVGKSLLPAPWVALLGSVLFLANSSYYEVPLWTGVGNFQSLTALLYLGALGCALRAPRSARPWAWSGLFGLLGLAAFFTYEPAFSVLLVGVVAAGTSNQPPGLRGWRGWIRPALPVATTAAAAVAFAVGVKAHLASSGDSAMFLPKSLPDVAVRLWFLVRAVVGIFTLRGDGQVVDAIVTLAVPNDISSPFLRTAIVLWILAFLLVAAWLVARGSAGVRLATLWFAIHLGILAASIIPQSRHFFLAAIPAALLTAGVLAAVTARLARRLGGRWGAPPHPAWLALLPLLIVLPPASRDLSTAAKLFARGTAATRQVRAAVLDRLAAQPPLREVVLVNLPAQVAADGFVSHYFVNGIHEMVELTSAGRVRRERVRLLQTLEPASRPGSFANGSRPATDSDIDSAVRDLCALVLVFDGTSRTFVRATTGAVPDSPPPATATSPEAW